MCKIAETLDRWGVEKGRKEGMALGLEEGRVKGREEGRAEGKYFRENISFFFR